MGGKDEAIMKAGGEDTADVTELLGTVYGLTKALCRTVRWTDPMRLMWTSSVENLRVYLRA